MQMTSFSWRRAARREGGKSSEAQKLQKPIKNGATFFLNFFFDSFSFFFFRRNVFSLFFEFFFLFFAGIHRGGVKFMHHLGCLESLYYDFHDVGLEYYLAF